MQTTTSAIQATQALDYLFMLIARATFGLVRSAAKEMLQHGTFDFAKQQIADADLCALFSESVKPK